MIFRRKSDPNWIPETEEKTITRVQSYILHFLDAFVLPNTSENKVTPKYLILLDDLHQTTQYC